MKISIIMEALTGLFETDMKRASRTAEQRGAQMKKQFLLVAAAAAAMGTAIFAASRKGANEIDAVVKSARRLDATVAGFRAVELAAGEAGVPVESLTDDLQNLNRVLATIDRGGPGADALGRLGISVEQLRNLDADAKIATIADSIMNLGLSAGETTAMLRDLGIKNREMVLLMMAGGDAIRSARADIEDYGLAVSDVDAAKIEAANDAIGRLGLVSKYAYQQIAIALTPALGDLAQKMTDSLREGGLLRRMIDSLVGNLDRLATYAGIAVAVLGTQLVTGLTAARLATLTLAGAMTVLRTALIRTWVGALIVGLGELALRFDDIKEWVKSFFGAGDDVAAELAKVEREIQRLESAIRLEEEMDLRLNVAVNPHLGDPQHLNDLNAKLAEANARAEELRSQLQMVNTEAGGGAVRPAGELGPPKWTVPANGGVEPEAAADATRQVEEMISAIHRQVATMAFAEDGTLALAAADGELQERMQKLIAQYGTGEAALLRYRIEQGDLTETFRAAGPDIMFLREDLIELTAAYEQLQAATADLARLQQEAAAVIEQLREPSERYADEVERLNRMLDAGFLSFDQYTRAVKAAEQAMQAAEQAALEAADAFVARARGIVESAAASIEGALADGLFNAYEDGLEGMVRATIDAVRRMLAELAALRIIRSIFPGGIEPALSKFASWLGLASGTTYAPGGMAWVGERGPELMHVPRGSRVFTAEQSARIASSREEGKLLIVIDEAPGFAARVRMEAEGQAVKVVRRESPRIVSSSVASTYGALREVPA